jgi:Cd2+/Zn2+-exporting ATPase
MCSTNWAASCRLCDAKTVAGKGVKAKVGKHEILAGNLSFIEGEGVTLNIDGTSMIGNASGTMIYVAQDNKHIGTIVVSDMLKSGAKEAIAEMMRAGVKRFVMLTGDSDSVASKVAAELGIHDYRAELLPQDKVSAVEELLKDHEGSLAFIGDGINDAPVLSRADVGIAMGSLGSDAAIEAADVVIMDDDLSKIPAVMRIAAKTLGISRQNIVFALFVKFACLVLGAIGIANMWVAVFADVGVAVLCILNSMRMLARGK